ncbi:hypothetical protein BZG36_02445 [Bifiguratus adelaidae]|uniref:Uncharacterized protein n=1 Tax=Bifiguratus adelaidae TaxID=1938954 RepID=A0A261Y3K7_9FUNG|nr:hypothetical protein BZG36_02445 [Bifiguratus adelaidae]
MNKNNNNPFRNSASTPTSQTHFGQPEPVSSFVTGSFQNDLGSSSGFGGYNSLSGGNTPTYGQGTTYHQPTGGAGFGNFPSSNTQQPGNLSSSFLPQQNTSSSFGIGGGSYSNNFGSNTSLGGVINNSTGFGASSVSSNPTGLSYQNQQPTGFGGGMGAGSGLGYGGGMNSSLGQYGGGFPQQQQMTGMNSFNSPMAAQPTGYVPSLDPFASNQLDAFEAAISQLPSHQQAQHQEGQRRIQAAYSQPASTLTQKQTDTQVRKITCPVCNTAVEGDEVALNYHVNDHFEIGGVELPNTSSSASRPTYSSNSGGSMRKISQLFPEYHANLEQRQRELEAASKLPLQVPSLPPRSNPTGGISFTLSDEQLARRLYMEEANRRYDHTYY